MKKLFFLVILLFLSLNVFAAKYYLPDENTFKDTRNFDVKHFPDGTVSIQGNRIGFAVTGTIAGQNVLKTTKDFNWTWGYDENRQTKKYQLTATNDTPSFQITQDWNFTEKPKVSFTIKNRLANITNAKFWWVILLDRKDVIRYANEEIHAENQTRNFDTDAVKNFIMRPEISNKFGFDFQDAIESGYSLAGIKVIDGTEFDYPNIMVLAVGFTKNNGNFPVNTIAQIDPKIINTGYMFPTSSGELSKNQYAQWVNDDALKADDGNYSTMVLGQRQTVGDFNFSINPEWAIRSINIQGNGLCNPSPFVSCSARISAQITDDNGNSYGDYRYATWGCPAGAGCPDSTRTFTDAVDNLGYPRNFNKNGLGNGNFMVDMNCNTDCTTLYVDAIQVSIDYIDGVDQNVTTHEDPAENVFHLTIADLNTQTINRDSTIFYSNFDVNLDLNGATSQYTYDLSRNQAEMAYTDESGTAGGWTTGCWNGTPCYSFKTDGLTSGAWLESEKIIDDDVNQNLTIIAQVYPDSNITGVSTYTTRSIVSYSDNNALEKYALVLVRLGIAPNFSTRARFSITTTTKTNCNSNINTYPLRWTQLAATYDGNSMKVYQDGVLRTTCAKTGRIGSGTNSGARFTIGSMYGLFSGVTNFFEGKIDEPMVLDVTLSGQDIIDLNNMASNIFYPTGIKDFNSQTIVPPKNTFNLYDVNASFPSDSNVSVRIGDRNGTYQFSQQIGCASIFSGSDCNFHFLRVRQHSDFAIRFDLNAGRAIPAIGKPTFYTPIMDTNFKTQQYNTPCNAFWNADFNISCASSCTVNENADLNNNKLVLNNDLGAGTITFNFDVNGISQRWIEGTTAANVCRMERTSAVLRWFG